MFINAKGVQKPAWYGGRFHLPEKIFASNKVFLGGKTCCAFDRST
jgi:hypothetical protein